MDAFLRGMGYWLVWVAAFAGGVLNRPDEDDRALWRAAAALVAVACWPLAFRASALRGDAQRRRPPPRWAAALRRGIVRWRWPIAVVAGWLAAAGARQAFGRPWLVVLNGLAALGATLYAIRPLPPRPGMPPSSPTGVPADDPYRALD